MLGATRVQIRRPGQASSRRGFTHSRPTLQHIRPTQRRPLVCTNGIFDNIKKALGGGGNEDAARKAIEDSFGKKSGLGAYYNKDAGQKPADTPATSGGGGFGGLFSGGSGAGGGGGGWKWGGGAEEGGAGGGREKPIGEDLRDLAKGLWVLITNAAVFLIFADILHRSLDWCCQIELLLLVGAPTQAFERVASKWYNMIEWIEKNCLGWDIPEGEDMMPLYEQIALYYPEEHAYTFDQYKYPLTDEEKTTLRHWYALRYWERDGGYAGDVNPAEVQRILDKYEPLEADRRAWREARWEGREDEYWAQRKEFVDYLLKRPSAAPVTP